MTRLKVLTLLLVLFQLVTAQTRREVNLKTWEFSRDEMTWTQVDIPHDWAIAGPFDKKWDLQRVAIEQNGETEATEKSGRSGALPWIGEGWYRTSVDVPVGYDAAELVFDGAMSEPRVSVNGEEAGYWAYGYNAFRVDVSRFLKAGKLDINVHLQNVEESLAHSSPSRCCSFTKSCPTLCDPINCSTPGFPVRHCLPEFAQNHVH